MIAYSEYIHLQFLSPAVLLDYILHCQNGFDPSPLKEHSVSFLNVIEAFVTKVKIAEKVTSPVYFVLLQHLPSAVVTSCIATLYSKLLDVEISWALLWVQTVTTRTSDSESFLIARDVFFLLLYDRLEGSQAVMLILELELILLSTSFAL